MSLPAATTTISAGRSFSTPSTAFDSSTSIARRRSFSPAALLFSAWFSALSAPADFSTTILRRRCGLCFVGWRPSRAFPAAGFGSLVLAAARSRPGDAAAALMGLEKQLEHEEEGLWGGRCW